MKQENRETYMTRMLAEHTRKNHLIIDQALQSGRINGEAAQYLKQLYSDDVKWFREVFYFLGKCFGAPKARVMQYDYETGTAIDKPISISDINPLSPYIVQHRLDADPMRNQFFKIKREGYKIDLAVSSIVTVIVGAQKNINRALDKITGKYYRKYVDEVVNVVYNTILNCTGKESNARAIADKMRIKLESQYISTPSQTVLSIIGSGHEDIAVALVRALDKVPRPRMRLQDVWRVKCLFDLIPQARTFIERVREMMPNRILSVRDNFYDMENLRNYRDAKLIIDIGTDGHVVPMEIICQVRSFFEFERMTHKGYEKERISSGDMVATKQSIETWHEQGVRNYNSLICQCLEELFDRVGWNLLYNQNDEVSMFEGFPKRCTLYYPSDVMDRIIDKLDTAIKNEVFSINNAPVKLSQAQISDIYRFMARFVLVAAMPYSRSDWNLPNDTKAGRLFNFVMTEVQRYYKKDKTSK